MVNEVCFLLALSQGLSMQNETPGRESWCPLACTLELLLLKFWVPIRKCEYKMWEDEEKADYKVNDFTEKGDKLSLAEALQPKKKERYLRDIWLEMLEVRWKFKLEEITSKLILISRRNSFFLDWKFSFFLKK